MLLLFGLSAAFFGLSQDPPPPTSHPPYNVKGLLKRFSEKQKTIHSLRVSFVQTNEYAMLAQKQVLEGEVLLVKPGKALYLYTSPQIVQFLFRDGYLTSYVPAQKTAWVLDARRQQERIYKYLALSEPMEEIADSFEVHAQGPEKDNILVLNLVPTKKRVRKHIAGLTLWLNTKDLLIQRFRILQLDGDVTEFTFSTWQINPELKDELFHLSIPKNTSVKKGWMGMGQIFHQ